MEAVKKYQPVAAEGLVLYPIRVKDYELFESASPAISFMQQTLPVRYAVMPLLSAFYTMDFDALSEGKEPCGLFYRALLFLALCLRLGEGETAKGRVRKFKVVCDAGDNRRLKSVRFRQNGEEEIEITPAIFSRIRPIIAAQNGIEIIHESANAELVAAEAEIGRIKSAELDVDFYSLRASVAAFSMCDEEDIDLWPILKFLNRQRAYQRAFDYLICSLAQASGCKWKGGNPCPSLFYDRIKNESQALMPLSSFAGGAAQKAVFEGAAS